MKPDHAKHPLFGGRRLVIATQHQKEKVIAPVLENALGVDCFADQHVDTDSLGTFSGEVERELVPLAAAREKCIRAMKLNNCDLAVASEGSFGPHPTLFFVPADEEILLFLDQKNGIEIIAREISTDTNFNGREICSLADLLMFAEQAGFPQHGLILRKSRETHTDIYKGITDKKTLKNTFEKLMARHGSVYVETDMRALYNPSRMQVIAKVAEKLLHAILSECPNCQMPGFGITSVKAGLPCSLCGSPTRSTLSYMYLCKYCRFQKEEKYPHQKTSEDPTYCDICNP